MLTRLSLLADIIDWDLLTYQKGVLRIQGETDKNRISRIIKTLFIYKKNEWKEYYGLSLASVPVIARYFSIVLINFSSETAPENISPETTPNLGS